MRALILVKYLCIHNQLRMNGAVAILLFHPNRQLLEKLNTVDSVITYTSENP